MPGAPANGQGQRAASWHANAQPAPATLFPSSQCTPRFTTLSPYTTRGHPPPTHGPPVSCTEPSIVNPESEPASRSFGVSMIWRQFGSHGLFEHGPASTLRLSVANLSTKHGPHAA